MLKRRIIPIQLLLDGRLVKTTRFADYRDVGDPVSSTRVYNSQFADELVLINIARDTRTVEPLAVLLEEISEVCFMPLTVGGGIREIADVKFLIRNGADKVLINSAAYSDLALITEAADRFGSQAVVVGVDAAWSENLERYEMFSDCGRAVRPETLDTHITACIKAGAGEIMIQSIDRDGTMNGYDIALIRQAGEVCDVPVIAAGGSGNYEHLKEAFLGADASAVACGSLFNFSDSNPIRAKAYLSNYDLPFKVV